MLRGLTWEHTRGAAPLQALSHVWREQNDCPPVIWEARSLKSFAEDPLDKFIDDYDLIVFDYPFAGDALERGWLIPIDTLLDPAELAARRSRYIGRTFDSFVWNGQVAALPIDAATHVCAWRPDLLADRGHILPTALDDTLTLAQNDNSVIMPMTPTAVWGALISICAHGGKPPMSDAELGFSKDLAMPGLSWLRAMATALPRWCATASPVAVLNRMSAMDEFVYCPLTYGYSTYGMDGYAAHRLSFGNIRLGSNHSSGAILGGAGIGVSSRSHQVQAAFAHAAWLTSESIQSTLYGAFGGQPASIAAWDSPLQNRLTGDFYSNVRPSMENCYHRPNRPGFHDFQTKSAALLHNWVHGPSDGDASRVLDDIDNAWLSLCLT